MMSRIHGIPRGSWLAWAVVVLVLPTLATAAPRQKKLKPGEYNPSDRSVEMFQAHGYRGHRGQGDPQGFDGVSRLD